MNGKQEGPKVTDKDVETFLSFLDKQSSAQKSVQPTPPFYSKLSELFGDEAWATNLKLADMFLFWQATTHHDQVLSDSRYANNRLQMLDLARSDDSTHFAGLHKANAAAHFGRDLASNKERGDMAYDRQWNVDEVANLVIQSDNFKTAVWQLLAGLMAKLAAKSGEGDPETIPATGNVPTSSGARSAKKRKR